MDVTLHWFGLGWALSTLVGLASALAVLLLALGRLRAVDGAAGLALAAELLVRGPLSSVLRGTDPSGMDLSLLLLDVWTLSRPLLHAAALALVGLACWRWSCSAR